MREVQPDYNILGRKVAANFQENLPDVEELDESAIISTSYEQFKQEQKDEFSFNSFFERTFKETLIHSY